MRGAHGDEAAVTLGEPWAFPHIAEEHRVGKVGKLGGDVAHEALRRRNRRVDGERGVCAAGSAGLAKTIAPRLAALVRDFFMVSSLSETHNC
jgi:hypothetical protein